MVSVTSRVNGSSDQHSLENSLEIFSLLRTNSCCSLIYFLIEHVHTCVTKLSILPVGCERLSFSKMDLSL